MEPPYVFSLLSYRNYFSPQADAPSSCMGKGRMTGMAEQPLTVTLIVLSRGQANIRTEVTPQDLPHGPHVKSYSVLSEISFIPPFQDQKSDPIY